MAETREVTIDVTEDDIIDGIPRLCFLCPVARAAYRALGVPVAVTDSILEAEGYLNVALPDWVRDRIAEFDARGHCEPFDFTVVLEKGAVYAG